jgi:hypothetical protein
MLFGQKRPKMHVFSQGIIIKNNIKGVKIGQNRSKSWAIVPAFWPKTTENVMKIVLLNKKK